LLPKSMTLNELDRRMGRHFRLLHRIRQENPILLSLIIEMSSVLFRIYQIVLNCITLIEILASPHPLIDF